MTSRVRLVLTAAALVSALVVVGVLVAVDFVRSESRRSRA